MSLYDHIPFDEPEPEPIPERKPTDRPLGEMTLSEARAKVFDNLEKGSHCLCCDQYAKMYKRIITSAMVFALGLMHKYLLAPNERDTDWFDDGWLHTEKFLKAHPLAPASIRGDVSKYVHWGVLEARPGIRDDRCTRLGWYRITPLGGEFADVKISLPKHAHIYNDELIRFSGELLNVRQCADNKFSYDELMGWKVTE